jgi:hypothetical protein
MEANLYLSQATVDELKDELDGLRTALKAVESGVGPGRPFDGRDERLKIDLQRKIAAIESELAKRNA